MPFFFTVGAQFLYRGIAFQVWPQEEVGYIMAQRMTDMQVVKLRMNEIIVDPTFKPLSGMRESEDVEQQNIKQQDIWALPEYARKIVRKREDAIEPLVLLNEALRGNEASKKLLLFKYPHFRSDRPNNLPLERDVVSIQAKAIKESERTIRRWYKNYKKNGRDGLIPKKAAFERTNCKVVRILHPTKNEVLCSIPVRGKTDAQIKIIEEVIQNEYLKLKKLKPGVIVKGIRDRLKKNKLPKIAKRTLYDLLKKINKQVKTRFRDGQRKFKNTHTLVSEGFSNEEAQFPLQIVQADNAMLKIHLRDEIGKLYGTFPYLTIGIDVYPRMPWGMELSMDSLCTEKVKRFLEHGILPKWYQKASPEDTVPRTKVGEDEMNTTNEWECSGLPAMFVYDNGSDFASKEIKRVVKEVLKREVQYCPPGMPEMKGVVERFVREIKEYVATLPGAVPDEYDPKEYNPEEQACLTLDELKRLIIRWLVDVYQIREHSSLPNETPTPLQRWREGLKISGPPCFMTPNEVASDLFGLFPEIEKAVTRYGLRFHNITYRSDALQPFVGDGKTYRVRWDPDDVSHCYFLDDRTGDWIEVLAVKPSYHILNDMNKYYWDKIVELARNLRTEKLEEINDSIAELAIEQMENEIRKAQKRQKKTTREQYKMKQTGSTREVPSEVVEAEGPMSILDRLNDLPDDDE